MHFQILDNAREQDRATWLDRWEAWPDREIMAHPDYVALFSRPCDRAVCALGTAPGRTVLFPLVLRPLAAEPWARPGEARWDATTPYGYGGPFTWGDVESDLGAFWAAFGAWAHDAELVSTFARLSLFPEQLAPLPSPFRVEVHGPNVIVPLADGLPRLWQAYDKRVRRWVRLAERSGITVELDLTGRRLDDFLAVYLHTMRRRDAAAWYFFSRAVFERLVAQLHGHFAFFHATWGGKVVSTELVLASSTRLYAFLGGTLDEAFPLGPNYLLKHAVVSWGVAEGKRQYVLGGGHEPGDGLVRYKGAFAPKHDVPFHLAHLVHDERAYRELCEARADAARSEGARWTPRAGFFPAYHA